MVLCTAYLKRHPKLCRQTVATSMARAKEYNKERVYEFFDLLENISERYKLESTRIFNVDESGFSTVQKKTQKIVARKGKKEVGVISSGEKGVNATMCQCIWSICSSHEYDLSVGAPQVIFITVSETGYINSELFVKWMQQFISSVHPTKERPVLPLLDGHTVLSKNFDALMMANPNPITDLKQRVKTLEGQVRLLLPLIEEVRVLKKRLDSRSLQGLEARKEEEKVGSSDDLKELKEKLKLKERELRETQAELEKLKEESEMEKVELRQLKQKFEEHQLRLQQEESKEEALMALREELQAKGEELKKLADELQAERQKTAKHRAAAEVRPNLEQKDSQGKTVLHRVAERGETLMVQLLLDVGSQVNAVDYVVRTPLWLAAEQGRQDACRALLAAGARPDVKSRPSGRTALHEAARHGHGAVCELLLAAGARPNEPDASNQWTVLHWAAFEGHAPVVQLLLQHGAERGARDEKGRTALDLARLQWHSEVAAMLQG